MRIAGTRIFPGPSHWPKNGGAYINPLLAWLVGGTFVFAGALKIADPAKFVLAVANYHVAPHASLNLIAIFLPWIEFVAGCCLLAGVWPRGAALVITALTALFAVAIVSALARGLSIECGCFGTLGGKHIGLVNLALDLVLFCLATLLLWRHSRGRSNFQESRSADSRVTN